MFKSIKGKKIFALMILAVLCVMFTALPVLAGEGDGSGGGKDVPLGLTASDPANGSKNVSTTADINLTFNKNVVNLTVKDNNMKCFSLSANGSYIPIQVNMPDDQVDFEHRRDISIDPLQDLKPGTIYRLVISGQLQAKNGMTLGSPVTVSFTTAGSTPVNQEVNTGNETQSSKDTDSAKTVTTTAKSEQQPSTEQEVTKKTLKNDTKEVSQNGTKDKSNNKSLMDSKQTKTKTEAQAAIAIVLVLIVAGIFGYHKYSHHK